MGGREPAWLTGKSYMLFYAVLKWRHHRCEWAVDWVFYSHFRMDRVLRRQQADGKPPLL